MAKTNNYIKIALITIVYILITITRVSAAEITAVDFQGNVIGQVISTGLVINSNGENIGSITADSLIINENNEIIGGVVPQGIAIGNDNRMLGKVHSDGVVRSLSGKVLGKALPNGIAVDDNFTIIGSILFPGLIYSSEGKTIGRLTGSGTYTNLDGQEIGYVSANGYAYRKTGDDYVLDGRLISSKMVVSNNGKFIGSISPSGRVIDFEGKDIGNVHANDYVYNDALKVIGKVVRTGYAFDLSGRYIGIISYNGAVINGDKTVGFYRSDGKIINDKETVIGFSVNISATANDNKGKYLGILVPNGLIMRGKEIIGRAGANKYVFDREGNKIGEIIETGPIYDALAKLKGESMRNGNIVSLGGGVIGQIKGRFAYDSNGVLIGGLSKDLFAISLNNNPLGIVGVDASIQDGANKSKASPFGYVFNSDGKIIGQNHELLPIYGLEGLLYSYVNPNGELYRNISDVNITQTGTLIGKNGYIGNILSPLYALNYDGIRFGNFANNNLIMNKKGGIDYKVIPGNYVVESQGALDQRLTPIKGFSGNRRIALNFGGDLLGYSNSSGEVADLNGNILGHVIYGEYVVDNNNSVIGQLVPFVTVNNEKCQTLGIINGQGEILNNREVVVGKMLPNGQVLSDVGSYVGYALFNTGLIDINGNFVGTQNLGVGVDFSGKNLGCANRKGLIYDNDNALKYSVINMEPAIDFDNKIIGNIISNGSIVDNNNQIIGHMQPNGDVVSKSKKVLGNVMKYKVAFSNDNKFLGTIHPSGEVLNQNGNKVGHINFDGSISSDGETIGYGLYDFYVYDENFITYGYITKDGTVLNFLGSKVGNIDKGFVVNKKKQLVARIHRDFIVRDVSNNAVGELQLDGNVVNFLGENIGYLSESGSILNPEGQEIAKATPLQYYIIQSQEQSEKEEDEDWQKNNKKVQITDYKEEDNITKTSGEMSSGRRKIVGIAISPDGDVLGDIYDDESVRNKDGEQIGFRTPDGIIVDMNHNTIGIEDIKHTSASEMFVPAGAFGQGNPYGIGSQPSNLGPGGGYGQGERYDPIRANALNQLQQARRSDISVGRVSTNVKMSNFTGYEEDGWPGVGKNISTWRVDMSQMILEDKPIPAVLSRSVYASEGFGSNIPVTAIVERNIYAEEGRNIVIPAGSRVIGALGGEGGTGGSSGGAVKIGISWRRLIRPDGSQFTFGNAQTADAQGRAGAIGYLDEQLLKKYTMPTLTTIVESATAYLTAAGEGTTTSDGGSTESSKSQAAQDARDNFLEQMNTIFDDIMNRKANIRSVTYIPAGTRIIIFPNEDLWLNDEKRDKEKEVTGGYGQGNSGLTDKEPETMGTRGGATVTYDGTYNENVRPAGGGLVEETPAQNPNRRIRQLPPATIQQMPAEETTDDVPALL